MIIFLIIFLRDKDRDDFCYKEFKKIYPWKVVDAMRVFPGVDETLTFLKSNGIKIGVLSCMVRDEVEVNLSLLDFRDFDIVFSLDDYRHKRPMPNGLVMIMKKLNVSREETMYVGDTVNDIRMAKNAGVVSVAVKTGAQDNSLLEKESPDYLIDDFSKLRDMNL